MRERRLGRGVLARAVLLIALDPPRAQAMLGRRIAFLRPTLQALRAGTHTLADEFARVDDDRFGRYRGTL